MEDWAAAIGWHSEWEGRASLLVSTDSSGSADNGAHHTPTNSEGGGEGTSASHKPQWAADDGGRWVEEGQLLLGLPEELQLAVVSLLSAQELAAVSAVCRELHWLVSGERSLRRPLVGLPERYLLFRPRIPLAHLEQSPQPPAYQNLVLDYLREEGFLFVSLEPADARVLKEFKKCAGAYLRGLEERSASHRKKLQYSKKARSLSPVGYAEMDELHGYLACGPPSPTRKHKKKKFPWPKASKREKKLARRYWRIMARVVTGMLRNVADSLGIPQSLLLSLLRADASPEEAWVIDRIRGRRNSNHNSAVNVSTDNNPSVGPKVLLSIGKTQGLRSSCNTNSSAEWNQPVLKMFHFREGHPVRPNFRTMHEYSRGLFKLVTAVNDGSTPCGMQMLMPRAPNALHRNFLPIFRLAEENDICVFAGFSLSKLCQVFSGPMGIRPVYLTANVGYDYPAAPSGSVFIQFDAHVSYPSLHQVIEEAAAARGIVWNQPVSERLRCTNREFFNKRNPFGAFWFRSLSRRETQPQPTRKRVKWVVVGGAMACLAVPLMVVATPLWVPVGGMIWVCRGRAARTEPQER